MGYLVEDEVTMPVWAAFTHCFYLSFKMNGVGIYQHLATYRFDYHILDVTELLVVPMVYGRQA